MKKFIFILTVLLGSAFLILISFTKEIPKEKETVVSIDFSEGEKLYKWDIHKKSFIEASARDTKKGIDDIYFYQFSPIDGIYYRSTDKKPFTLEKKGETNIVTFGSGVFICNIQTGLEKYEFRFSDIILTPDEKGVFLVDTTKKQGEIFSFDTFLDVALVSGIKQTQVTKFTLFPSLLFKHDSQNTNGLKKADVLRISMIDSLYYTDLKTGENAEKNTKFILEVQKNITARINIFVELYNTLSENKNRDISFFDTKNILLMNGSKKEALLKNMLVENIKKLFYNPQNTQIQSTIQELISEMKELNGKTYTDGLSILKQYYYIASFSHFASKDNVFDFSSQKLPILTLTEKILNIHPQLKKGEYYAHFSDLFSVYYFLNLDSKELTISFEKILKKLLDSKVLKEDEFLPFVFFVTQYLSIGPINTDEETMLIISHLFRITNDYYTYNKGNISKIGDITSTIFYNYTKIFVKMQNLLINTFVDKTTKGFMLKENYVEGENINLDPNFINTFIEVINGAKKDTETKKEILTANKIFQSNSQIIDSYSVLKNTLSSFDIIISMFSNYSKYLNDFNLNESNKSARGFLIEQEIEMSKERVEMYLKGFNNIDITSLQLMNNNFQKNGFYEVSVSILGNVFHFNLYEQEHILTNISYTDNSGNKHVFPNITIPLDQKEKQLKELSEDSENSENSAALKYKYDFRNFFEITFLKGDSLAATNIQKEIPTPSTNTMSPELQLFAQKELLEKDFKNIENFLSIGFKNINVAISNDGNYLIELNNITKSFSIDNENYSIELNSKYIFNRHNFSRLTFKVQKMNESGGFEGYEFNGISIEIIPIRILLLSLPEHLKDLGYYIKTIKQYYTNQQSIIVDITGKRILLDSVPYSPIFETP